MVFNTTLNNISAILWQSVLLVEERGVPGENHRRDASHWQTLSHKKINIIAHYCDQNTFISTMYTSTIVTQS
jgi:hypothetical protein